MCVCVDIYIIALHINLCVAKHDYSRFINFISRLNRGFGNETCV